MNVLRFALLIGLLQGCASAPSSDGPAFAGPRAFVQGTRRGRESYYVGRVDGARLRRPTVENEWAHPIPIPSGERTLVIQYEESDPFFPDRPRGARTVLKALLHEGIHYAADGRDEGRMVSLWIKRLDTGEPVSKEVVVPKEERPPLKSEVPNRPLPIAPPVPLITPN